MATKTIRFSKSTEDSLFDGTSAQDRAKIDVSASIAKFDTELTKRIEQTYPDAEVTADAPRTGYFAYVFETADDPNSIHNNYDVSGACQQLAEELFDDGSVWMVDA